MPAISLRPAEEASAWTRADLERDDSWIITLEPGHIAALDRAFRAVAGRPGPFYALRQEDFPLPELAGVLACIRAELSTGRGLAQLRGLPVERYSDEENRLILWGLGTHLGTAVTQNAAADLVAGVFDRGLSYSDRNVRAYQVAAELGLHNDNSDIVALMCVRQAPVGGESMLVSATSAYNRMLARHPELVPLLFNGFTYCRKGEQGPGEPPFSREKIPVFSEAGGRISCRYARSWITHAEGTTGVRLSPLERLALDSFDAICHEPDLLFECRLRPGDVQFANNYTVLHARRAFQDDPKAKRLMYRLWLEADWLREVDPVARFEFIRYGNSGRTAAQLLAAG